MIINYQLGMLNLPPILIMEKSRFSEYYPALEKYETTGNPSDVVEMLANLLIEALHRRITKLTAKKIIPLTDWAKKHSLNQQAISNKATRGTIPAFREKGHWMIDSDYKPTK